KISKAYSRKMVFQAFVAFKKMEIWLFNLAGIKVFSYKVELGISFIKHRLNDSLVFDKALISKLKHVAEDGYFVTIQLQEITQSSLHAAWVGIVSVENDFISLFFKEL